MKITGDWDFCDSWRVWASCAQYLDGKYGSLTTITRCVAYKQTRRNMVRFKCKSLELFPPSNGNISHFMLVNCVTYMAHGVYGLGGKYEKSLDGRLEYDGDGRKRKECINNKWIPIKTTDMEINNEIRAETIKHSRWSKRKIKYQVSFFVPKQSN